MTPEEMLEAIAGSLNGSYIGSHNIWTKAYVEPGGSLIVVKRDARNPGASPPQTFQLAIQALDLDLPSAPLEGMESRA